MAWSDRSDPGAVTDVVASAISIAQTSVGPIASSAIGTAANAVLASVEAMADPTPDAVASRKLPLSPRDPSALDTVYSYARPPSPPTRHAVVFTAVCLGVPFFVAFVVSMRLIFPTLAGLGLGPTASETGRGGALPPSSSRPSSLSSCVFGTPRPQFRPTHPASGRRSLFPPFSRAIPPGSRLTAVIFAACIALSGLLVELLLCELIGILEPGVRDAVFRFGLYTLLALILVVVPLMVLRSAYSSLQTSSTASLGRHRSRRSSVSAFPSVVRASAAPASRLRSYLVFQLVGLASWLAGFWYVGGLFVSFYISLNQTGATVSSPTSSSPPPSGYTSDSFREGTLERIGVLGITLMGLLAGFAGVSNIWHNFGSKPAPVTDADLVRKHSLLQATAELLSSKQTRLRALSRKLADSGQPQTHNSSACHPPRVFTGHGQGNKHSNNNIDNNIDNGTILNEASGTLAGAKPSGLFKRLFGAFRSSQECQEISLLEAEIAHLEETRLSISDQLYSLQARYDSQRQAEGLFGRVMALLSFVLAIYCAFRVALAVGSVMTRSALPTLRFGSVPAFSAAADLPGLSSSLSRDSASSFPSPSSSLLIDPISHSLALVTQRWSPSLDQALWRRQLAFLPSGLMLVASLNSVLQTVVIFTRINPSLMRLVRQNGMLMIGQLAGIYVLSAAVLLRIRLPLQQHHLPSHHQPGDPGPVVGMMSTSLSELLRTPLEAGSVDAWFESCFLLACAGTGVGIWLGRQLSGANGAGAGGAPVGDGFVGPVGTCDGYGLGAPSSLSSLSSSSLAMSASEEAGMTIATSGLDQHYIHSPLWPSSAGVGDVIDAEKGAAALGTMSPISASLSPFAGASLGSLILNHQYSDPSDGSAGMGMHGFGTGTGGGGATGIGARAPGWEFDVEMGKLN